MCYVEFSCFIFYVLFLVSHSEALHKQLWCCQDRQNETRFTFSFHPVYRLLPSCWAKVTRFKISLLFSVRIMESEMSHVSFRLCHQEMNTLQDNIHAMIEPFSQTLKLPLTLFCISISLILGISISVIDQQELQNPKVNNLRMEKKLRTLELKNF